MKTDVDKRCADILTTYSLTVPAILQPYGKYGTSFVRYTPVPELIIREDVEEFIKQHGPDGDNTLNYSITDEVKV